LEQDQTGNIELLARLQERVKELSAIHRTARLLQDENLTINEVITEIAALLPSAFQYPEDAVVRILFKDQQFAVVPWTVTPWVHRAHFSTRFNDRGSVEVCYLSNHSRKQSEVFLEEELSLLSSVADMVRGYFQRKTVEGMLQTAYSDLETKFRSQMVMLEQSNKALEEALEEQKRVQRQIEQYQRQLQTAAQEMTLVEARERRLIAAELHDQIGQSMLAIKMKLTHLKRVGRVDNLEQVNDEIISLLDQTIKVTRSLTFEISSPILYDLGLHAAIERLVEQFGKQHDLDIELVVQGDEHRLPEQYEVILYQSVKELLVNIVKHSGARKATISLSYHHGETLIVVSDDGYGFDPTTVKPLDDNSFGLFSIRERLRYVGGGITLQSALGKGTTVTLNLKYSTGKNNEA